MSKVNTWEDGLNDLVFSNADFTGVGDAGGLRGSATAGNLYIALFTGDPTDSGSVANECDYTSYARVAVARASSQWTSSSGTNDNDNEVAFPKATGGSNVATHFGICKAGTAGVADLIYHGALDASLAISNGITPKFAAGALNVSED